MTENFDFEAFYYDEKARVTHLENALNTALLTLASEIAAFRNIAKVTPILKSVRDIIARISEVQNGNFSEGIMAWMSREVQYILKQWSQSEDNANTITSFNNGLDIYHRNEAAMDKIGVNDL
ncbi:hypothetical protein HYALB_00000120 [Hymenoscyphus albidus]|uniref:Uncharacterized protein n=1 Tax=Hymenoscyphus albidus TaxID=595503 RepID=A0A9N9LIW2_9HELO|nr:hypothetical protein HYALB_00000120 [Hymenoscyphus albidus]